MALARQRRQRRLWDLGAACFPDDASLSSLSGPGDTAESAIEYVMLQSASDAHAPPVAVDAQLHRTSPAVRRLLGTKRGAHALLSEAASLGQLASYPRFALGAPRRRARPLCGVCGYWGTMTCRLCGERVCSKGCHDTHAAARCERALG